MILHLVDGTYELFRHFYGLRRFNKGIDRPYGAVVGVLQTVLQMIENGDRVKGSASRGQDTCLGVATDHVIESFRNRLWPDYKTGSLSLTRSWRWRLIQTASILFPIFEAPPWVMKEPQTR